jgi:hypothetical protein
MKLKKGDVIYADRGLYRHYGVYVKDSCVIHYTNPDSDFGRNPIVRKTTLKEFCKNNPYFVYQFPVGQKVFPPWRTVWRAKSRLGDSNYDIFSYNCEHFVYWCKTGIVESSQIKGFFDRLSMIPVIGNSVRLFLDRDMQWDLEYSIRDNFDTFVYNFENFMSDLSDKSIILIEKVLHSEHTNFDEAAMEKYLAKYKKENCIMKLINGVRKRF